nr:MAG TPA: hypothetical protein [Caudoviricetes sp.]
MKNKEDSEGSWISSWAMNKSHRDWINFLRLWGILRGSK